MLALTLSLTLALTPTLTLTKEFTALCHYAYLNGIQRSTYELIAVIVSMVTFAVHSLRGLPLELGTVMPALLLFQLMRLGLGLGLGLGLAKPSPSPNPQP